MARFMPRASRERLAPDWVERVREINLLRTLPELMLWFFPALVVVIFGTWVVWLALGR
jgi:hypothetical protein